MSRWEFLGRSLATAATWPFGVTLTSWLYMWRTTPLHRSESLGTRGEDGEPALPDGVATGGLQPAADGVGPLFHRRYSITVRGPRLDAGQLMAEVVSNLNGVAPTEFARFEKRRGDEGAMNVGDEYLVRMPGPWNGPVRVVSITSTSFRFATMEGHLEAGQIEFRASSESDADLVFTIESWARSGDRLSKLLYQNLRMAKEVQLHMWTSFLEKVARIAGGHPKGGIEIRTMRVDHPAHDGTGPLRDSAARRRLDELHDRALNFDPGQRDGFLPAEGWDVDRYCQPLPAEPPGEPVPNGSWETAAGIMRNYEFADPAIVRALYYPDRPLAERDMLLEARFWGLRFRFGVRVGGVADEVREVDGRPVRVWGWNYRTLQGHLEMGQMDFEVWKWLDSGEVEFRAHRFSRRAGAGNPLVRLGLRVFGRHQQVKFANNACLRMARLTEAALESKESSQGVPSVADQVEVLPASDAGRAGRRLLAQRD